MAKQSIHPSVTYQRVEDTLKRAWTTLDNPGICLACGHEQEGCEPDARRYECEECEKKAVYGVEEIMLIWGEVLPEEARGL